MVLQIIVHYWKTPMADTHEDGLLFDDVPKVGVGSTEDDLGRSALLLGIQNRTNGFLARPSAVIPRPVKDHQVLGRLVKFGDKIVHFILNITSYAVAIRNTVG